MFTRINKMRAAMLYGPEDIRIEDVNLPEIRSNEVLVRVKSVGVCHSDVRCYLGIYKRQLFPFGRESYGLSGHEWSGEVVKLGDSVTDFDIGDRVVPEIIVSCGTCQYCARGMVNLCRNKTFLNRGYAEYAKIPSDHLLNIPEGVSFDEAAFSEPIAVCLHTYDIITPKLGDTVLVIGAGPMGLIHLQIAKQSGAAVIVSEINEGRLKIAMELGADATINPNNENLSSRVGELTDGYGADAAICATGAPSAIESTLTTVCSRGKIVLFGGTYPSENVVMDPNLIHYGEICVTGSYDHLPTHMSQALRLLALKRIKVSRLITNVFPLDQLRQAFQLVEKAEGLKILVKP